MTAPNRTHGRDRAELTKGCLNKRRYSDELTARAAAQIECGGGAKGRAMWIYACATCRGWHLTNRPQSWKFCVTADHIFSPPPPPSQAGKPRTPQFGGFWGASTQDPAA